MGSGNPVIGNIEIVWDGIRVYRVPTPLEIEALSMKAQGYAAQQISNRIYPDRGVDRVQARISSLIAKTGTRKASQALYQLYRLEILPSPRKEHLIPMLTPREQIVLGMTTIDGLTYEEVATKLKLSSKTIGSNMTRIFQVLRSHNQVQALKEAVAHGDLEIKPPKQLWRGVV